MGGVSGRAGLDVADLDCRRLQPVPEAVRQPATIGRPCDTLDAIVRTALNHAGGRVCSPYIDQVYLVPVVSKRHQIGGWRDLQCQYAANIQMFETLGWA